MAEDAKRWTPQEIATGVVSKEQTVSLDDEFVEASAYDELRARLRPFGPVGLSGGTWTCHVCGDERPDEAISVRTRVLEIGRPGLEVRMNARYCNDRGDCAAGAGDVLDRWAEPLLADGFERVTS